MMAGAVTLTQADPPRSIPTLAVDLIGTPAAQPVLFALALVLLLAAYSDLRGRRIPNLLTFPAALLAMLLHALSGGGSALLASALAYVLWLGLSFFLYATVLARGIGAGDLKLLAACASFLGWMPALYLALLSFAAHVLWMVLGWFANGVALVNFASLLRWLILLVTPRAARLHFIPIGTPDRSPHAPFVLLAAVFLYVLWQRGWVIP